MTVNGHRPTTAEVSAAFDEAGIPDVHAADDPLLISEQAVIGSAIQSAEAAAETLGLLRPEHFTHNAHRVVLEAVERLADAGVPVEITSVMSELASAGMLAKIHGPDMGSGGAYLHSLTQRAGSIAYHAAKVIAGWRRAEARAAVASCWQVVNSADFDVDEHLDQVRQRIEAVTAYAGASALRPNSEAVYEVLAGLEDDEEPGLSTGYRELDDAIGTLRAPDLLVIGGRPGNGKSLMGLCVADYVGTRLKVPVLFASLEMTEHQLTQRRIAATARVPLVNIVRHQATDDDWQRISRAQDRLADTALHIDDTSSASIARIRARLRVMARTGSPARLLVIDYLGFMSMPKAESRQQAVAEVARQCKNSLAREFGIPVILLCQLNRLIEGRSDKRPTLSDLRESGEIEQSADIVILLHREDVYERESPRAGEIDLIIPKNRQGPLCTVTLLFQGHYGRIVSLSREDREPDGEWSPSSVAEHR